MRLREAAWPAGIAAVLGAWYASDSLRHRRELGDGYELHGREAIDIGSEEFMRAAETITGAPITTGSSPSTPSVPRSRQCWSISWPAAAVGSVIALIAAWLWYVAVRARRSKLSA